MKRNRRTRRFQVVAGGEALLSFAGGSLLTAPAVAVGLDRALSAQLVPWKSARATHDLGKVVLDLAVAIALGGDCLSDLAVVRSQPDVFGQVASDPTVSRLITTLARDAERSLVALRAARAIARQRAWELVPVAAGPGPLVIDIDATLVQAHSEKQGAQPTFKRGFGFSPILAFADHGIGWDRRVPGRPAAPREGERQQRRRPHHRPHPRPGATA